MDPKKVSSFDFGVKLADALIKPYVSIRSTSGLSKSVQHNIEFYTGEKKEDVKDNQMKYEKSSNTNRRCGTCLDEISGCEQKAKKDKLAKNKSQCQSCGQPVCKNHLISVCQKCK